MSSRTPFIRQVQFLYIIPQLIVLSAFIFIYYLLGFRFYLGMGAINYLMLSFLLRTLVPIEHRKGILNIQKKEYQKAIENFENSFEYFHKREWLDKYRSIFLLSSSRISYKEMALVNIAFCYAQNGNGEKGKEYYKKALDHFPDSEIAKTGLKMLESVGNENSLEK